MKTSSNSRLITSALLALQAAIATVVIQEFSLIQQGAKSSYAAQAIVATNVTRLDQTATAAIAQSSPSTDSHVTVADGRIRRTSRRTMNARQAELLRRINNARRARNIAPLRFSSTLSRAAQVHVRDMVEHNRLTHTGSDGSSVGDRARRAGYRYRYVGENLAAGTYSVKATFDMWMNSSGHRRNILNPNYREIGIGYYLNAPNTTYDHYWVTVFGASAR